MRVMWAAIVMALGLCASTAQAGDHPWLKGRDDVSGLTTLDARFAPPAGFARVTVKPGSFDAYLRALALRTDRVEVRLFDGRPVTMPSAAIIPLELGPKDLHQCADSVMRLHAEWLWAAKRADEVAFHYTSGHRSAWSDWRRGARWRVRGAKVTRAQGAPVAATYAAFRAYLDDAFRYGSTRSLHRDTRAITDPATLQAGDIFLQAGSPGHVVILLDVAEHADGRRVALLGQGYIPAREVHVIKGRAHAVLDQVWFHLPTAEGDVIDTPTWAPFSMRDARRWKVR